MLDCLPIYHWFHCGNPYSGAQGGMRYLVAPAKKADPADESGKRKIEYLTAPSGPAHGAWNTPPMKSRRWQSSLAIRRGSMPPLPGCTNGTKPNRINGPIFPPFWTVNRINKQINKQRPTGTLKPSGAIFLSEMK